MDNKQLRFFIEAALLAAGRPLTVDRLQALLGDKDAPTRQDLRAAIMDLRADYAERGIELVEVASGYRIQVKSSMTHRLEKLWEERPPRYSRALLETLAIIVYRQPVTRGEIEEIRGVAVSTNITRTLLERAWIHVVGHRDVPGKPAMFGTTKDFLDYFGLKKLDDLPPLSELKDFESLNIQLDLSEGEEIGPLPGADEQGDGDSDDAAIAKAFAPDSQDSDSIEDNEGVEPPIGANVASLDAARAAASDQAVEEEIPAVTDRQDVDSANVVPLKQP